MADLVIRAEHVGKRYQLGRHSQDGSRYRTLRDTLAQGARDIFRRSRRTSTTEEFWALRDVSFDVKQGEVVGIIGRNGAGKSTLLKILSRITEPTTGKILIKGRVASLLEVGTGFHPELTGRENIFLNGAILGMSRVEIKAKFDEIVAFAEVEKFLETPVKRYSSGMYVRLAFAVAAHLEPEVLVVDEVLAVGDGDFQRKCLDKMEDVGQSGRTILFVSHNMAAVTRLCSRTVLLNRGTLSADGLSTEVVRHYLSTGLGTTAAREWETINTAPGNDIVRLTAVRIRSAEGAVADAFDIRRPIGVEIAFSVLKAGFVLVPNFVVMNEEGICVFHPHDWQDDWRNRPRPVGDYSRTAWIPGNLLAEGTFVVGVAISSYDPLVVHSAESDAVAFQVIDSREGDSARGDWAGPLPGVTRPLLRWTSSPRFRHSLSGGSEMQSESLESQLY